MIPSTSVITAFIYFQCASLGITTVCLISTLENLLCYLQGYMALCQTSEKDWGRPWLLTYMYSTDDSFITDVQMIIHSCKMNNRK